MDYGNVYSTLAFSSCDTRQCNQIPIVDNRTVELNESFFVTLESTSGLDSRITFDPVDAEVGITDNDGLWDLFNYIGTEKVHTVSVIVMSDLRHNRFWHNMFSTAAVVGMERKFYQVSEDVGVVEVCAIVYRPEFDCPIEFQFDINLIITNGSAGKERVKIVCNVVKS